MSGRSLFSVHRPHLLDAAYILRCCVGEMLRTWVNARPPVTRAAERGAGGAVCLRV